MSKRSPGTAASQKKGAEIHRKERERSRAKKRAKYERYSEAIIKEGLRPVPYETWLSWDKANSHTGNDFTDLINIMGLEEKEQR